MNSRTNGMLKVLKKAEDDYSLIHRFNGGDETAFKLLVNKHREKVRNLVGFTINNSHQVDDLSQEVFIKVYRNLPKFRFEAKFTSWLYTITLNVCRDEMRKKGLKRFLNHKQIDETPGLGTVDPYHTMDIRQMVRAAINRLPEKLRLPLYLKDIEGFSYKEIAEMVGCEMGTVKSRLFRAREALREILKPHREQML